ncbi:MAG: DUF6485 family protein [Defluviitaleaceae bacterium]|nr:DUF6485 family protein [Defluviitaleaceae bacterium]
MSCESFCTCTYFECPEHPQKHEGSCTPCIEKNLREHEIPACFWNKIGDTELAKSDYIFMKFAEKVFEVEGGKS